MKTVKVKIIKDTEAPGKIKEAYAQMYMRPV